MSRIDSGTRKMMVVARRRHQEAENVTMLTMNKDKKPRRVRGRDKGDVIPVGVELSPAHAAALDTCSERERRTKKAIGSCWRLRGVLRQSRPVAAGRLA